MPVRRPMTDHIHTVNFPCRERDQGAFSTDLPQKSRTYIIMGYTYSCMGGARSSFRRLTYKYCVLDPSKTSFSQVLSILHTLLSLIFFTAYSNTVDCAEHVYIHLHSNYTYISTGTAAVHTFLHTNKNPDFFRFMGQSACIPVVEPYASGCLGDRWVRWVRVVLGGRAVLWVGGHAGAGQC